LRFLGEAKTRLNVDVLGRLVLVGDCVIFLGAGFSSFTLSVSWNSRSLGTTSSNSCPMGALRASSSQAVVTQWTPLSSVKLNHVRSAASR